MARDMGSVRRVAGRSEFRYSLEVIKGFTIPAAKGLDNEGNEVDSVGLARAKMFVHLDVDHGLDGSTGLDGGAWKCGFAKRRCHRNIEGGLTAAPIGKVKVARAGSRVLNKRACFFDGGKAGIFCFLEDRVSQGVVSEDLLNRVQSPLLWQPRQPLLPSLPMPMPMIMTTATETKWQ